MPTFNVLNHIRNDPSSKSYKQSSRIQPQSILATWISEANLLSIIILLVNEVKFWGNKEQEKKGTLAKAIASQPRVQINSESHITCFRIL